MAEPPDPNQPQRAQPVSFPTQETTTTGQATDGFSVRKIQEMSEEEFRKCLEFFDARGSVNHVAIWNDVPVRIGNVVKAVLDNNGWLPELIVRASGGNMASWFAVRDSAVFLIRVCDDVQKGMRVIYVSPMIKDWLNGGIEWCTGGIWGTLFPGKPITPENAERVALLDSVYQKWLNELAVPWWSSKRRQYKDLQAMMNAKAPEALWKESVAWIASRAPEGARCEDISSAFVQRFGPIAVDMEKTWLDQVAKIATMAADYQKSGLDKMPGHERETPDISDQFVADVQKITMTRIVQELPKDKKKK